MKQLFLLHAFFLLCFGALRAQTPDNAELQRMFDEDQRSRQVANIDWSVLGPQDSLREVRVYELIKEGALRTGRDHFNAAMIFQHGLDTAASGAAVAHMRQALALDTTINRWLLAAAIDRDLMRREVPQIYGTQFTKEGPNGKWHRYTIDSTKVSDAERRRYGVETLAEQRLKEREMNLAQLSDYFAMPHSIGETTAFIRMERKRGPAAAYDVSESAVNSFGYELMAAGKLEDALKIFRLNTELYPKGFNAYDSLGECLLRLNRKEEGLAAYRKSLALNPKNNNARKILAATK